MVRSLLGWLLLSTLLFGGEKELIIAVAQNSHEKSIDATYLCKLYNQENKAKECRVVTTKDPLNALVKHQADFAVIRNDRAYNFQQSSGSDSLRSIVALHKLLLFYITDPKSQCTRLEMCKGKSVHVAYHIDNSQGLIEIVRDKLKLPSTTLVDLNDTALEKALKKREVVGALYIDREPSAYVASLLQTTHMTLHQLEGKPYSQLVRQYPYLSKTRIDAQAYPSLDHSIITLSLKSLLVTNKDHDEASVYHLTQLILRHMQAFQKRSPIFDRMSRKTLLEELAIPQHRGAFKAFNEE